MSYLDRLKRLEFHYYFVFDSDDKSLCSKKEYDKYCKNIIYV